MSDLKSILIQNKGYAVLESFIPKYLLASFRSKFLELQPIRALDSKKNYAEKENIKNLNDISIWWSQRVDNFPEIQKIRKLIDPIISESFLNIVHYNTDVVTINPKSSIINPHVDTPYRFGKWNFDPRLLGIQCIITMDDTDSNNGSTGIVPYSQKRNYDINQCYQGMYDRWFMENMVQPNLPAGSLLLYNCKVLHSSMPNNSTHSRPAILINYLDQDIIEDVQKLDNVYLSNK